MINNFDKLGLSNPEEIGLWLRLLNTKGIGNTTILQLLSIFESPSKIFASSEADLKKISPRAKALLAPITAELLENIKRTLLWLESPDHFLINLFDKYYPKRLLDLSDPPLLLFVHGNLELLAQPSFAIVGSRKASLSGIADANMFAQGLAKEGLTIVSGLAMGIDAAAHRGALFAGADNGSGSTIAVIGTGIDKVYPENHAELNYEISKHGAVISEFGLGSGPMQHHFPMRNRIIAALSLGVLVVEATAHSGSLITARIANELGRDIFAVPNTIASFAHKGSHALIKQGAKLTESVEDILCELPSEIIRQNYSKKITTQVCADKQHVKSNNTFTFDELCASLNMDAANVSAKLLTLELGGQIKMLPDGRYLVLSEAAIL